MDLRNYHREIEQPMSFEEWRGSIAPQMRDEIVQMIDRLHEIDYKKQWDDILKLEYQEYLSNLNGNWLL